MHSSGDENVVKEADARLSSEGDLDKALDGREAALSCCNCVVCNAWDQLERSTSGRWDGRNGGVIARDFE
jgi:hypothetical protein